MDYFTIFILVFLGLTCIIQILCILFKVLMPEKKEDVKGVFIKGHYSTHCIGPCVVRIWHSDE